MKLIGGPGSVMAFLTEIRVPDIQVANSEKEIGRDWKTQYREPGDSEGRARTSRRSAISAWTLAQ